MPEEAQPSPRRLGLLVCLLVVVALLAAAGWLAWSGLQARQELRTARTSLQHVRSALLAGDQTAARHDLASAQRSAARAHDLTDGPVWAVASAVPVVGNAAGTSRGLAAGVDRLANGPLAALVGTTQAVDPHRLWNGKQGLAVDRLRAAAPRLGKAARQLRSVRRDIAALPGNTIVDAVDRARTDLLHQLGSLDGTVTDASQLARLAPPMLGADGPRRYLMVFQNPAEARGTGGLIGAYAVLEARHGRLQVTRMGSNTDLHEFEYPVLSMGQQFKNRYTGFGATRSWRQANVSPHFPDAARIWLAMWQQQFGERLDGVIATDPVAMGYLLRATGPAQLPTGQTITPGNAADATMRKAYAQYSDNAARDAYFQLIAHSVMQKVLSGAGDPATLVKQLGKAASERRLQVYSTNPDDERQLARTKLAGVLPDKPGPFAGLVVNDVAASKLDYYLDRSLSYVANGACSNGTRKTHVRARLTNTAPKHGLPDYVVANAGEKSGTPRGTERLLVSLFLAKGADMDAIRLDGKQSVAGVSTERGHTVLTLDLEIRPGQTRTVDVDVTEPLSSNRPVVPVQPLVRPQQTRVHVPPC